MNWYTLFCQARKEFQVAHYLQSHGTEIYHPTLKVKPVNPRASKIKSYFPRYIFVHADIQSIGTSALKWIPRIIGLVEFGGDIAIIPDEFITTLRRRISEIEMAGGLHLEGLQQGDAVHIKGGPFAGFDAIFDHRLSDQERVQVLLRWMGREMRVKVNANVIEKRRRG
jgi:transcription antitermination factor NusG